MLNKLWRDLSPYRVWVWLSGVLLLSLLLFFVVSADDPKSGSLKFEAAKSLLQIALVSVVGAVISLVTGDYQRAKQSAEKEGERETARKEYRDDLLKSLLSRLMNNYTAVKKARRLLRGRGLTPRGEPPADHVLAAVYDAQIDVLNEAQLAFEHIRRDVVTSETAFAEANYESLVKALGKLDEYLGELVTEFESCRRMFAGDPASCRLGSLPKLEKFLGDGQTPFQQTFVYAYHDAQGLLRAELLHPKLPARTQVSKSPVAPSVDPSASKKPVTSADAPVSAAGAPASPPAAKS
jgi:hypothetical protein